MKKCAFIIPYFGKFNNYFQLFLNSCKYNPDYDWIIFTDDHTEYNYPSNVYVHYCEFKDIKTLFKEKIGNFASLDRPYKLCDYKPTYGYTFQEYLKNYKFWGYCDTDLVFGNIDRFLTDNIFDEYDKIGFLGHFTIYRNTNEVNEAFMNPIQDEKRYITVYSEPWNHSFDEEFNKSVNNIFINEGIKFLKKEFEANIYTKSSNFKITRYDFNTNKYKIEDKTKSFFVWNNGNLYRYIKIKNKWTIESYMYIHLQSRPMKNLVTNFKMYKIIPNTFENVEDAFSQKKYDRIKVKHINLHYFKLRTRNLFDKIKKRIEKKTIYNKYEC